LMHVAPRARADGRSGCESGSSGRAGKTCQSDGRPKQALT
jgi:hypothetical protein